MPLFHAQITKLAVNLLILAASAVVYFHVLHGTQHRTDAAGYRRRKKEDAPHDETC